MNKKRFTASLLKTILFGIITAFYTLGFLTLLSLNNTESIGYYAAISGPILINLASIFYFVKNLLIVKKELLIRKNAIVEKEVAKKLKN